VAIVGDAYIVVHAITSGVEKDIQRAFSGMEGVASRAAQDVSRSFNKNLKLDNGTSLGRFNTSLQSIAPNALKVSRAFNRLVRIGFVVQSVMGTLAGSIGALVGGIGALGGAAIGAAPAIVALGGAFGSLIVGMQVAKAAFKGIGGALNSLQSGGGGGADQQKAIDDAMKNLAMTIEDNQKRIVNANNRIREAQLNLNEAFRQGKEEIQQLGFEAESAAISEQKAAIELEKARETLAGAQDLPPNSRVRREAELAFSEAELNYRMAKDRATDLATEQDRLAKTGVEGTQVVIDARGQLAEAEENLADTVVQAARAQEDAYNRLAEAQKGLGGGGGADPFAKLTESQKKFTLFLYNDVLPAMGQLKAAAADSFLPVLQQQMERMMSGGLLLRLRDGIEEVSKGLAQATVNFTDVLMRETALENFSAFFTDSAKLLPKFGSIFGNTFAGVLAMLNAASGLTEKFVGSIDSAMLRFRKSMELGNESGMLAGFFYRAGQLAGQFGKIFSNIFGGLGALMSASIGPGSGGQMVLDWLQEITAGFKNVDKFSLGNFLRGSAENMIAMLDTLGTFISAIVAAGANPAVKVFWDTIALGAGTFRNLVQESVKTAPVLAQLLLHLGEMIAIFSDSGSVIAFLNVLQFITGATLNLLKAMRPLLDILGPVFAALSALVVVGKGFKLVFTILTGIVMSVVGSFGKLIGFLRMTTGLITGETLSTAALAKAKHALNMATLEQTVAESRLAVIKARAVVAFGLETASTAQATVAKTTAAVASRALVVAEGQLAAASVATGATMMAAFWPITLALAAIAAAVAAVMIVMAIEQANFEKATGAVTAAMDDAASATDIYSASLLAIPDGKVKTFLSDTTNNFETMRYAVGQLGKAQSSFFGAMAHGTSLTTGLANAFGAIGKSLSNMAAEDLPSAQKQFKSLTEGLHLNSEGTRIALDEMDDYKTALEDQAEQLGINLMGQDGQIDKQKLVNFAMGEGEIAIRRHTEAMLGQINATRDAALATISASDAYKAATTDIEGNTVDFNLEGFFTSLQSQIDAANAYVTNMTTATQLGLSDQGVAFLNSMGADGQVALAAIAAGGVDAVNKFNGQMAEMYKQTSEQTLLSSQTYGTALRNIGETYGDDVANAISTGIAKGTFTAEEAVNALGITVDGITPTLNVNADTSKVTSAIEAAIEAPKGSLGSLKVAAKDKPVIDVDTKAGTDKVLTLEEKLKKMNGSRYTSYLAVETELKKKNGGLINWGSLWGGGDKDGGLKKFAGGGSVYGPGGPRDDRIPAMLSAGEYVVNALATKRYLPLLNSINNGSPTFASTTPQQGAGAPTINMTINPSPGMDERALASMVSRELAFQMRKGSVY
jgi:hypothetical protein